MPTDPMPPLAGWADYERAPLPVVLSVSGGKDSTALGLALRARGVPFRAVFADTGWEHPWTYRYLREVLPDVLGVEIAEVRMVTDLPPDRVAMAEEVEAILGVSPSAMVRRVLRDAFFPSRRKRWCTQDLKVYPLSQWIEALDEDVHVATGIRAAESRARATWPIWEDRAVDLTPRGRPRVRCTETHWRPLMHWTEGNVIAVLRAANAINPLYQAGTSRVGCWPCINARREDLRLVAQDARRVEALRLLECYVGTLAAARGVESPTFFQTSHHDNDGARACVPIDAALDWSKQVPRNRAGQLEMFWSVDATGCARWGLCPSSGPPKVSDYEVPDAD